jgi:tyrosine decarboxylase/aspartate 1-decarboxylase
MLQDPVPALLSRATELLEAEFGELPSIGPSLDTEAKSAAISQVLEATAHRLADNYPYFHPLYAGQMLKPPHPVARAAYALAMTVNPNNHARDGGRASTEMEIEAVRGIAAMFGWGDAPGSYLGHLTSSGTIANLEALWIAGQLAPGRRVLASAQAHYTHNRISAVLKLPFASIPTDNRGRMSLDALEAELLKGDVGTVVATLGTTGVGAVDPLPQILALRTKYGFRVHVDGAYGGYFRLIPDALDESARQAYEQIDQADSIVVDPHKHGLQPYGCGCVLFRDPAVGRFYKHDSPFTYFSSKQLHLGEISLECSRAGASAVALWATQQLLPLTPGGEFARGLGSRPCGRPGTCTPSAQRPSRPLPTPRRRPSRARHCRLEAECGDSRNRLATGSASFCRLRHTGFAPRPCRIAADVVRNGCRCPFSGFRNLRVSHLSALGFDEARAHGVAPQNLGQIRRLLRGSTWRIMSMTLAHLIPSKEENVLISQPHSSWTILPHEVANLNLY